MPASCGPVEGAVEAAAGRVGDVLERRLVELVLAGRGRIADRDGVDDDAAILGHARGVAPAAPCSRCRCRRSAR